MSEFLQYLAIQAPLSALVAIVAVLVSAFVGYMSRAILARQERLARRLEQSAGIQSVERVREESPFASLGQVMSGLVPTRHLRLLMVSGASTLYQNRETLMQWLESGVRVDVLLLDPESDNWLFREHAWLTAESRDTLALLKEMTDRSEVSSRRLRVRLYPQPVLEMLMFVDDEQLFISSYLPIATPSRLVYEVRVGEQSLYDMYQQAFWFLWEHAVAAV